MITKKTDTGEVVYGVHPIHEILRARKRKLFRLYTTRPEPKQFSMLSKLFPKGLQIQYVERPKLDALAGTKDHQGVVALTAPFVSRKVFFNPQKHPFLLLLDGIQDVRNLGAILRTAYCVGVDGVIIPHKSTAPITSAALKASAGLAERLDIFFAPSSKAAVQLLEQAGYHLYVTMPERGKNAMDVTYTSPLCIVIGSEGAGVSPELKQKGQAVFLGQRDADISYNASVAAGILLFFVSHRMQRI